MFETKILRAMVAAAALLAPVNVVLAQYRGPPIIIQTPQLPPPATDNLKPLADPTLLGAPQAAPVAAAPAVAVPAQPCATNTRC